MLVGEVGRVWLQHGWTPLHFAAKAGHLDVVKLLVESGACTKHETIDNKMPISLAASAGHTDVLSYLLRQDRNTHLLLDDSKVSAGELNAWSCRTYCAHLLPFILALFWLYIHMPSDRQHHYIYINGNKNLAITNRSRVSCAHNTLRAFIGLNITP